MYISPNSKLKLLSGCPLDTTYDHTLYFATATAQYNYFASLAKKSYNDLSYIRANSNMIRISGNAEDFYDCNYLMFQNTSFGSKWFYAYIKQINYIANDTAEILYEMDPMQTWFFDYTLEQCFVEREHAASDTIGSNLVPENLELGEYVADDFTATGDDGGGLLAPKSIVIACTFDSEYNNVAGGYYSGLYSGLHFEVFPNNTAGAADAEKFISGAGSKSDGIVAVFLMPTAFVTGVIDPPKSYTFSKPKSLGSIGGYTPKNNKLYTYPYNFLYVTNLQGNGTAFPYEYFSGNACGFTVAGDMSCNPSVILAPNDYKGVTVNYDEKMVLSGYPQLGFTTDSFKAWLAQNASSLAVNALSTSMSYGLAASAVSAGMAAPAGVTAGAIMGVANSVSQIYQAAIRPNQAHGGGGSQTMAALSLLEFAFMHKHIQPQFARIIDDYFTVYGYKTNRVKTPNRSARPHWNYVKTIGCVITGSIPADDARRICEIYDRGITFWKNGAEVGNYSLNNSPA